MNQSEVTPTWYPEGWTPITRDGVTGGQASTVHVQHEDGREGMYRELRTSMSEIARKRFSRELDILLHKVQHESIVKLYEWNLDVETPWYISELGIPFIKWWRDQKKILQRDPQRFVESAIGVIRELASALAVCHENNIVHRDIKPQNIVVKKGVAEPWPILIDFGIAHDEGGNRLTPVDKAVGNARFSPDVMRNRLDTVTPWLDIFDLGQLLIWMIDEKAPKNHWQRPVHWKYAVYREGIAEYLQHSIRAFTAACSTPHTSPANGREVGELIDSLFPKLIATKTSDLDPKKILNAKIRGQSTTLVTKAELNEEIEASAVLGGKVYRDLRNILTSTLEEISKYESTAQILIDNPFHYQILGATDLFWILVGPERCNIQLRIKGKVVTQSDTLPANRSNREFWLKHMPSDAICFTFALEGGVIQAHNTQYLEGRWITIGRNGSVYLYPLSAAFGNYGNNDLGGSVEGPGTIATMNDVQAFAHSIFTNESYWEYVAAF